MHDAVRVRIYDRVFVCKVCNMKLRADAEKVKHKKIKCRKCGSKDLRSKNRSAKTKAA